jgi:hypothetical protein
VCKRQGRVVLNTVFFVCTPQLLFMVSCFLHQILSHSTASAQKLYNVKDS